MDKNIMTGIIICIIFLAVFVLWIFWMKKALEKDSIKSNIQDKDFEEAYLNIIKKLKTARTMNEFKEIFKLKTELVNKFQYCRRHFQDMHVLSGLIMGRYWAFHDPNVLTFKIT